MSFPPLRDRYLAALRAVGATPGGMRTTAFRSVMPVLVDLGLVELRAAPRAMRAKDGQAWFLTPKGRHTLAMYGRDET